MRSDPSPVTALPAKKPLPARRGAKPYLAASGLAQLCALARYTLLARLLGPEQLGIAATLILTAQFFESITDSGGDLFLIQDREGDEPRVQRLVQLVYIGRGLFIAAALALLSGPIAHFYNTPALSGALAVLAIAPLIAGFQNLDPRRTQRHNDFRREAAGQLVAESVSLAATATAAFIVRDFTAILYGLIARSTAIMIVSHITAERRYAIGYAPEHARRLARFSLPLMANGLLLFAGSQGDRLVIANQLSLTELGHYSATLLLIYYPSTVISRYVVGLNMPLIAAGRDDPAHRKAAVDRLGGQAVMLALMMSAGFLIVAPFAIPLLFGEQFRQSYLMVAMVAALQTARFFRLWPVTVALGIGHSSAVMANNLVRLLALAAGPIGMIVLGGLPGLLAGFILGELVAFATAIVMANQRQRLPLLNGFGRLLRFVLGSLAVIAWGYVFETRTFQAALPLAGATALLVLVVARQEIATIRAGRQMVARFLFKR